MKQAFKKLSPLQVDPDKVWADYGISSSDFEPATETEKENMVEVRKSVSYWRDAARRFKRNTVSMVALGIFIVVLLFAFLGPLLIPYNYANQYRSSQKLGPGEYSDQEALIKTLEGQVDCFYATALQPGSMTAIDPGTYYFEWKGTTYCFSFDKKLADSVIVLKDGELSVVREVHIQNGEIKRSTPLEFTNEVADGAKELTVEKKVFPAYGGNRLAGP